MHPDFVFFGSMMPQLNKNDKTALINVVDSHHISLSTGFTECLKPQIHILVAGAQSTTPLFATVPFSSLSAKRLWGRDRPPAKRHRRLTGEEHVVRVNPTKSHCKDSTNEKNLIYSWGTPLRNLLPQLCQMPGKCSFCWRPPKARITLKNIMNLIFTGHLIIKEKNKNYKSPENILFNPLITAACLFLMEQCIQYQSEVNTVK